jgi:hypothetical protein
MLFKYLPSLHIIRHLKFNLGGLERICVDIMDLLVGITSPLYKWMLVSVIASNYSVNAGSEIVIVLKNYVFISTLIAFIGQRRIVQGYFFSNCDKESFGDKKKKDILLVIVFFALACVTSFFLVNEASYSDFVIFVIAEFISSLVMYSGLILVVQNKSKHLVLIELLPLILIYFLFNTLWALLAYYIFVNLVRLVFIQNKLRVDWLSYR